MKRISKKHAPHSLVCLLALSLCMVGISGCIGKGFSIPGFASKKSDEKTDGQTAQAPLEAEGPAEDDLMHTASNGVQLGPAVDELSGIATLEDDSADSTIQQASNSAGAGSLDEIDAVFMDERQVADLQKKQSLDQLLSSVDLEESEADRESNLDALRSSLRQLNAESGYMPDSSEVEVSSSREVASTEPENGDDIAPVNEELAKEFPWALGGSAAEPVVKGMQGMLHRATEMTQQGSRIGSERLTSTARTVIEKTQSVLSPEKVTAEQILSEMKARQEKRRSRQAHPIIQPAGGVAANEAPEQTEEGAPVMIDLSREWINNPTQTEQEQDSIAQFAQSTVMANQPAQLPVITPARTVAREEEPKSQTETLPFPTEIAKQESREEDSSVVQLNDYSVDESGTHQTLSGTEEAATAFGSSREMSEEETTVAMLASSRTEEEEAPGYSSAPMLMAPGPAQRDEESGPSLGEVGEPTEEDEFAADFADVTEEEAPEIEEAPLLIDESELNIEPQTSEGWSTTEITLGICGLAFLAMMLIRWRR